MKYFEFYDKTKTYFTITGTPMTPELVASEYPISALMPCVVETDKNYQLMYGFDTLAILEQVYDIPEELTDEEALAMVIEKANTPTPPPSNTDVENENATRISDVENTILTMMGE